MATLLVLNNIVSSGTLISKVLHDEKVDLSAVDISCSDCSSLATLVTPLYGSVILLLEANEIPGIDKLASFQKAVVPAGRVAVYCSVQVEESVAHLSKSLLLAGFLEGAVAPCTVPDMVKVTTTKPNWQVGTKAQLNLKRKVNVEQATKTWTLAAADDEDMLDDEELLTEEDKVVSVPVKADDCEVGVAGRKACANCSCGRAEAESSGVAVTLTAEMMENPTSSCGSCYLGDAFRCSGCPYRGLPAFKPGTKVQLTADFLTADA